MYMQDVMLNMWWVRRERGRDRGKEAREGGGVSERRRKGEERGGERKRVSFQMC